jgi:hypothetical protein
MRQPELVVRAAIDRLLQIGLLETDGGKSPRKSRLPRHPGAPGQHQAAPESQEGAAEQKGTEHHHQEGNGTEKERNGTREDTFKTDRSTAGSGAADSFQRRVDDEEKPGEVYASPEDELKAIYLAKAGEPITVAVLDAIRLNLFQHGVSPEDFVSEVRKHAVNEWRNPAGFLRDLSKRFRSKTRSASGPATAAEAARKNYRCQVCGSTVPGEGARLVDGRSVPCACASPEYIARQRARGEFAEETPQ